jgi:hypothetical protein
MLKHVAIPLLAAALEATGVCAKDGASAAEATALVKKGVASSATARATNPSLVAPPDRVARM